MHQRARPARQGLGDVPGREGVPAADRVPLPAARGGLPRAARRHGRPHGRLPRLRQHRPDAGRLPHATAARRASTSTTTTTTPASATSTWSTSRPPARRRSSTTWRGLLGATLTPEIASALYVGLVTDTGRFMYENTDARTHRVAADADRGRRRRRRHLPPPLRARADREAAADRARARQDREPLRRRASSITYIAADDYAATGAGEEMTEGVIDHLRSIEGIKVAAVDPRPRQPRPRRPQGQPALQRRRRRRLGDRPQARAEGGTSAPPASRPTSSYDELVEFLCGEVVAQLDA